MVNDLTDPEFKAYFAGVMDSDGCFSISISMRECKTRDYISFNSMMRIGWAQHAEKYLLEIYKRLGFGKIYYSNRNQPHGVVYWQTTTWADVVKGCEFVKDYIFLKKRQCGEVLKVGKKWLEVNKTTRKNKPKELILEIAKVACNLNPNRQTIRYRNVKNYGYWEREINRIYREIAEAPPPNKGGMPPKYTDEQILAEVRTVLSEGYTYNKHRMIKRRAEYRFGSWDKAIGLLYRQLATINRKV